LLSIVMRRNKASTSQRLALTVINQVNDFYVRALHPTDDGTSADKRQDDA
jgi:hypothetical protein